MNPELQKAHQEKTGQKAFIKRENIKFTGDVPIILITKYELLSCTWLGKELKIPVMDYYLDLAKISDQDLPGILAQCNKEDKKCIHYILREEDAEAWRDMCIGVTQDLQKAKKLWSDSNLIGKFRMTCSLLASIGRELFHSLPTLFVIGGTLYGTYLLCSYSYKGMAYAASKIEIPEHIITKALESIRPYIPCRENSL